MAHTIHDHEIIQALNTTRAISRFRKIDALARLARLMGNGFTHIDQWNVIRTYGDRPWARGVLPSTIVE